MIIDRIEHLKQYNCLLPNLADALEVTFKQIEQWEEGIRYPFEGGFVFFQKGMTKPLIDSQFEAHRKYIDVQLVLEGSEYMAVSSDESLQVDIPYNEEKDVEKYKGPTHHVMKISHGQGYVCFPNELHKSVFHIDEPLSYTKAVIKLEI